MTLITRLSRLFRADMHEVLDRIEEPAALLRQAVRDMEEDLARDGQRLRRLADEREAQARRLAQSERTLREVGEQIDLAFEAQREDLARALIRRRLEQEHHRQLLIARGEGLARAVAGLEERIAANRQRLEAVRQRARLAEEDTGDAGPGEGWSPPHVTVREEDVELAFLRERQRRAQP
jgi:phage shock protein A